MDPKLTAGLTMQIDTREPWTRPWAETLGEHSTLERRGLETGGLALAANPLVAIERKTVFDFLGTVAAFARSGILCSLQVRRV